MRTSDGSNPMRSCAWKKAPSIYTHDYSNDRLSAVGSDMFSLVVIKSYDLHMSPMQAAICILGYIMLHKLMMPKIACSIAHEKH